MNKYKKLLKRIEALEEAVFEYEIEFELDERPNLTVVPINKHYHTECGHLETYIEGINIRCTRCGFVL